jgi:hypothetical protein
MGRMRRIGDLLISMSACTPEAIREALYNQNLRGARLGTNLLEIGAVDERLLAEALRRLYRVPVLTGDIAVDRRALDLVPRRLVDKHDAVPYTVDRRSLRVLMCDPCDLPAIDEIAFAAGKRVEVAMAPEARVWSLMRNHYGIKRRRRGLDDELLRLPPPVEPSNGWFVQPLAASVWDSELSIAPPVLWGHRSSDAAAWLDPRSGR